MKNFIQNVMDKQGITKDELNCIQLVMLSRDMNTSELVKLTKLSYTTAQNIATGVTDVAKMRVERFLKIAHGLGMTAEELYYYGREQPIEQQDPRLRDINEAFNEMNEQGRDYLWETSDMAKSKYHKKKRGIDVSEAK